MTPSEQIQDKILKLQEMLLAKNPALPSWLETIHTMLQQDASLVQNCTEEEINIIVQSMERQTQTVIVTEAIKKTSASKKLKNLDLDMDL